MPDLSLTSLRTKNSLILISVMVPLLVIFFAYDIHHQAVTLRNSLTQRGIILAQTGAAATGRLLDDAISFKQLTEAQVFDHNYQLIPGQSPQKYHTQYDSFTDLHLRTVEDAFLRDKVVVYAIAVDINGYVPTHNTVFSQDGKGRALDRSKRLFDDTIGNNAARSLKTYLQQEYARDTGETIWDISSPIYVNGRHWGAFRIGLSIEEANLAIAAVTRGGILAGLALTLALILLAVYISTRISTPVRRLEAEVQRVAGGDFTLEKPVLTAPKDEVGSLIWSFVQMVVKLRGLVEKTRYSAHLIGTYTQDLLQNSETASSTADSVTMRLGPVAENLEKLENSNITLVETAKKASENLSEAEKTSKDFLDSMVHSKDAMFLAADMIKELESQVEKVGSVIQFVSVLADQATLLAHKAVTEVDRFCTPENDFKELAVEIETRASGAEQATKEISDLFKAVRNQARQASAALDQHRHVILKGISVAKLSKKSLSVIVRDLENLAALSSGVVDTSKQLVEGVQQIHLDVETQTAMVKRFTEAAGTLEQVVDELQETINSLKV